MKMIISKAKVSNVEETEEFVTKKVKVKTKRVFEGFRNRLRECN